MLVEHKLFHEIRCLGYGDILTHTFIFAASGEESHEALGRHTVGGGEALDLVGVIGVSGLEAFCLGDRQKNDALPELLLRLNFELSDKLVLGGLHGLEVIVQRKLVAL